MTADVRFPGKDEDGNGGSSATRSSQKNSITADVGASAQNTVVGNDNWQTVNEYPNEKFFFNIGGNSAADLYRFVSNVESRMTTLESNVLTRFLIAEEQRGSTNEKLDELRYELRDEIRKRPITAQGPAWVQILTMIIMTWLAIAMTIVAMNGSIFR